MKIKISDNEEFVQNIDVKDLFFVPIDMIKK
jgi:hypothetical protein